ncbi:hypothetical protein ACFW6M_32370 [Streptomyces nigra]|uniref:hypothetical protein n=1 Tax=Streptomyces nigra TaxID=1827580 RepID=UPI003696D411
MRPLYVPVRLAATAVAVAAVAGCMSVGDDGGGGSAKPSHSAGQRGGEAPDGGPAGTGGSGFGAHADVDGKRGKKKGKDAGKKSRKSADPSDSPSARASASRPAGPAQPGGTEGPGPTRTAEPEPTRTAEPEPTPTQDPVTPTPTPPPAEPSSSAHEDTAPQLVQREPAPEAQAPA